MNIPRLSRRSLGRAFGWLWAAFAVSAYGSGIGFGAFPIIAVRVLHAGPLEVSALSSVGLAVGAVLAVPLGPWVEFRRKRPVMMAMHTQPGNLAAPRVVSQGVIDLAGSDATRFAAWFDSACPGEIDG